MNKTYGRKIIIAILCALAAFFAMSFAACDEDECTHSWNGGVVTTEATCTEDGVMTYTCTLCGATYTETIEATGHTYSQDYVNTDADGHYHICTVCGEADEVASHTFEDTEVLQAATETEEGIMGTVCTVCGYESTRTIEAMSHTAATTWTADENYHWHACSEHSDCGVVFDKTAHIPGGGYISIIEPTCTEQGYATYICDDCGAIYKSDYTAATGHTYDYEDGVWNWSGYESATLTVTCSVCNGTDVLTAVVTNEVTTEATCTTDGVRTYTATVTANNTTYTDVKTKTIAATGHTWNDGEVTQEPTCTEAGVKTYTCTDCSETKTESISATGHNYDYANGAWTWETDYSSAKYTVTCSSCQGTTDLTATVTDQITTEAAADNNGERTYTATVTVGDATYTDTKTVPIPATGHNYNYENGNWTWSGYTSATYTVSCTDDGCSKTVEYTAEITSEITTAATCTSAGVITYTATVTANNTTYTDTKTEDIAATGHSYDTDNITWTWNEYTSATATFTCTACTEGTTDHTKTETATVTSETTAATCTTDGETVYTASVTFNEQTYTDTKTVTISATGHSYESAVTEPTCTAQGYTTHTCSSCGDSYVSDYTDATGHTLNTESITWAWASDYSSATATFTCTVCSGSQVIDATVISEITTAATTNSSGVIKYTATVTVNGTEITDTKEVSYSLVSADFASDFYTSSDNANAWSYGSITYDWTNEDFTFTQLTTFSGESWTADGVEIKAGWINAESMMSVAYTASEDMLVTITLIFTGSQDATRLALRIGIKNSSGTLYSSPAYYNNSEANTLNVTVNYKLNAGDTIYFVFGNEGSGYPNGDLSITINQLSAIADFAEDFSTSTENTGSWNYGNISYSWDSTNQLTYVSGDESFNFTAATSLNSGSDGWTADSAEIKAGWISAGSAVGIAYTTTEATTVTLYVEYTGSCTNTDLSLRIAVVNSENTVTYLKYAGDGKSLTYAVTLTLSAGDTVYFIFMDDVKSEEKTDDESTYYPQASVSITFYEAVAAASTDD